jgi:hypothetical protein
MTRAEFAEAIGAFMREMSVVCLQESPEKLRDISGFELEIKAAQEIFRDPTSGPHDVLSAAFGVVDEYYVRAEGRILDRVFSAYSREKKGQCSASHTDSFSVEDG